MLTLCIRLSLVSRIFLLIITMFPIIIHNMILIVTYASSSSPTQYPSHAQTGNATASDAHAEGIVSVTKGKRQRHSIDTVESKRKRKDVAVKMRKGDNVASSFAKRNRTLTPTSTVDLCCLRISDSSQVKCQYFGVK